VWYLEDEWEVETSVASVFRALERRKWNRKVTANHAAERDEELRQQWQGIAPFWETGRVICIDESAANGRTGYRKYGYSPIGVTAVQSTPLKRGERWSVLPAYTANGFLPGALIYQGSVTQEVFNAWVESCVLPHCTSGYSVLVMDNCSVHKDRVRRDFGYKPAAL